MGTWEPKICMLELKDQETIGNMQTREQSIEDVLEYKPDKFSEEEYVDVFDWIVIDTKCSHCGREEKGWISLETS